MLQADYGWLFARIARMPETRSTTLAHLPAGTYATSTRASRQGLSCKGGRFHASDDYVYYELGSAEERDDEQALASTAALPRRGGLHVVAGDLSCHAVHPICRRRRHCSRLV